MNGTQTERLRFREARESDRAFVFELVNEPPWREYIGDPGPPTIDGAERYLAERLLPLYRDGLGLWVVETGQREVIGLCGLVDRDFLAAVDLGFAYLQRYWRHGYGREAAQAVCDYARGGLELPCLQAITTARNTASIGLLKTLDFAFRKSIVKPVTNESVDVYERRL